MAGRKTIRVTNVLGQEVMATATDANQLALNVSGFQAGVYLVEVRTDLGTTTLRVVKR
jgi:hypothetical protein